MNKFIAGIFIVVSGALLLSAAANADAYECSQKSFEGKLVSYCIGKTDRARNPDILFQFHGLAGNQFVWQWLGAFKKVRKNWRENNVTPPTVISLSMGPYWVLTDVKAHGALLSLFHDQVLPYFENYVGGLRNGERLLLGESMGGLNALQLYFKYPHDYSKVALECAALPTFSYDASSEEIKGYAKRTGAKFVLATLVSKMLRHEYPTAQYWMNFNPMDRVQKDEPSETKLYISTADQDGYGFFEGDTAFYQMALNSGRPAELVKVHGGHCKMDPPSLSTFLAP